jgi:hypothetical protein
LIYGLITREREYERYVAAADIGSIANRIVSWMRK